MSPIWTITKREVKSYFTSPLAYVITGIFSILAGWIFFNLLAGYVNNIQNLPAGVAGQIRFIDAVVIKFFAFLNQILFLICPMVSMRLFAEEKKQHSIELLYSAPISDWAILLGKYFSSFIVMLFMISMTFIFPIILYAAGLYETTIFFTGYVGITLNVATYLAIGIFASSLTENQIVAAVLSLVFIMFLFFLPWAAQVSPNYMIGFFFKYLGLESHFINILRGLFNTIDFGYYFSLIFFVLFSTKKVLESRNW
jgi:ABC-2 type transport system permease protein